MDAILQLHYKDLECYKNWIGYVKLKGREKFGQLKMIYISLLIEIWREFHTCFSKEISRTKQKELYQVLIVLLKGSESPYYDTNVSRTWDKFSCC